MTIQLGMFRAIFEKISIQNGLAFTENILTPVINGSYYKIYEKIKGDTPSSHVAGIFDNQLIPVLERTPGKYTGEMRKVIQGLHCQGFPVTYNYKFDETHGVYTAMDGSKWLIEISSSDGVRAMLLPILDTAHQDMSWLGYSPEYKENIFGAGDTIINLLTAVDLNSFYTKNMFYNSCGWAFNEDGSEAQNTVYTSDVSGFIAYRYKISISELLNSPESAVLSEIDSDYFKIADNRTFKMPGVTESNLVSFLCSNGDFDDFDAPIHVFYDGMTERVTRAKGKSKTTDIYNDQIPVASFPGGWPNNKLDYIEYLQGNIKTQGSGVVAPGKQVFYSKSGNYTKYTYGFLGRDGAMLSGSFFSPSMNRLEQLKETFQLQNEYNYQTCIFPINDRESVFQFRLKDETADNRVTKFTSESAYDFSIRWSYGSKEDCPDPCTTGFIIGNPTYGDGNVLNIYGTIYDMGEISSSAEYCCPTTLARDNDLIETNDSNYTNITGTLELVSSGNIDFKIFSKAMTTDNPYITPTQLTSDQYMFVFSDSVSGNKFCSSEMNGIDGTKYTTIHNNNPAIYPISLLATGKYNFWFGQP